MKPNFAAAAALGLATFASAASAEIVNVSDTRFLLTYQDHVSTTPAEVQRKLGEIGQWWSSSHTYSGAAANMSLALEAGGCFCERWGENSVEHMRVLLVMDHENTRTIRLQGALGPLQALGATGILTLTLAPEGAGTNIAMTYRVTGSPGIGLEEMAVPVDGVLLEQFRRFASYANS